MRWMIALALAFGLAMPAFAEDAPTKVRQELMKKVGESTKAAGGMVKGKTEFDDFLGQEALDNIYQASLTFGDLFPVGSETGDETEASPKIWEDAAGWQAKLDQFAADAKAASESEPATLDEFKAAFGQVAKNCKSCHEAYRIKKD